MIELEVSTGGVSMVDAEGDELRIDSVEDGRVYVTVAQDECIATVGPFTRVELEAMLAVAGMEGA